MRILEIPQRSEEWYAARRGLPTCSAFDKIVTPSKGDPSKSQDKLINELIAESLGFSAAPSYQSPDMILGVELEEEARRFYAFERGVEVRQVGLVVSDCGRFGGSPDGLVEPDGGVEIKCPSAPVQIAYVRAGTLPDDYKCQVHGHMAVTGLRWWDFLSYYPGLSPVLIRVPRDEFTERLAAEVAKFCTRYNETRAKFGLPLLCPEVGKEVDAKAP